MEKIHELHTFDKPIVIELAVNALPEKKFYDTVEHAQNTYDLVYPRGPKTGPHITLFAMAVEEHAALALGTIFLDQLISCPPIHIGSVIREEADINNNDYGQPYFSLPIQPLHALKKLHEGFMKIGLAHWDGTFRYNDRKRFERGGYPIKPATHIQKYGFLRSMNRFHPHITIGAIRGATAKTISELQELFDPFMGKEISCRLVYQIKYVDLETGNVLFRDKYNMSPN
ncbi:MAG: hypothetical protein ACI83D_000726 [Planctomycetota bacterium]|jgi:hypothetical protein